MTLTRRPLFYGLCLLAGSLLVSAAGLMHPILKGDGATQLATVAATAGWRAIHWVLLAGFAFGVWALNVLFMVGAGWQLAHAFTTSDKALTATHAVFLYDMLH